MKAEDFQKRSSSTVGVQGSPGRTGSQGPRGEQGPIGPPGQDCANTLRQCRFLTMKQGKRQSDNRYVVVYARATKVRVHIAEADNILHKKSFCCKHLDN